MDKQEEIPVIWRKPHISPDSYQIKAVELAVDKFVGRYSKKLEIRSLMVDFEMPKDSAGHSNKTFIIKIHITLKNGKLFIAESSKRSILEAMKNIESEIENQIDLTDRQKHKN
jgi:ribosome-associated translation inhibitor RaiA